MKLMWLDVKYVQNRGELFHSGGVVSRFEFVWLNMHTQNVIIETHWLSY